ncbi:hypothetical protein WK72_21675 [Burkholderia ubonensis]|nr:hypothetical protein WJ31_22190 [Burkholderia ubonensis]KVU63699.1 hypothetical protein WK72_21675 [Burkholderia ubonensis]
MMIRIDVEVERNHAGWMGVRLGLDHRRIGDEVHDTAYARLRTLTSGGEFESSVHVILVR